MNLKDVTENITDNRQ